MLGEMVEDPDEIEGNITKIPGLGLLPIRTTMLPTKTTRQVTFEFNGKECQGYEIHQGHSTTEEQIVMKDNCIGTYIHGVLDNQPVIDFLLKNFDCQPSASESLSIEDFKQQQYDRLADHVRRHVDIEKIYKILSGND